MKLTYKVAGVDRDAADSVVKKIGQLAKKTRREGVLGEIGHFGAFFELPLERYRKPVLVSSTDGVGTKIKIAAAMNMYKGIGEDLVNHCVNDIMCCGAEPLYFMDYLSLGKIEGSAVLALAEGLADACKANHVALIGGETAEMPDLYQPGEFDIAGTIVGIVEKDQVISGKGIADGDMLIGLESSGLHTNGYSLARKIVELSSTASYHKHYSELGCSLGEALLTPHRSYKKAILTAMVTAPVQGISHVTGGGLVENTRRVLDDTMLLEVDWSRWPKPAIFSLLQDLGEIEEQEMREVFNVGIGLVMIARPADSEKICSALQDLGEAAYIIGRVHKA